MEGRTATNIVGKRDGNIQMDMLLAEENLNRLDPLVERLNASLSGFRYDRKSLANLIGGLQQFLETAFGLKAVQQKPFPKLPAKLFFDLSADGPVAISARLCAGFMKDKGLKRLDWTKTEFRRELVDVVSRVRQELIRAGYIQQPRVMILPSCPQEAKLRHAISKMGGQIVPQSEASAATHILHPFPPTGNPDDGQEYLRTLELQGGMARVHWWYLPDSYDEWIPSLSAPPDVDVDLKPPGGRPWQIYYQWVLDSEKYNEWMNEADYETEEAAAENKRLREMGDDEKDEKEDDISKERERKRSRITSAAAAEVSPGYVKALGPGAVLREKVSTSRPFIDGGNSAVDLSFGQRQENSGLPVAATVPVGLRTTPAPYILPAKSSWFDLDKVHESLAWQWRNEAEDIDESSVQNINALIRELRTWLMDEAKTLALTEKHSTSRDASEAKALREKKQSVLARLEASAEALGLLKKPSSDLILGGYDVFSLEKVADKPSELSSMGLRYAWNREETEDAKRDTEQTRSDDEESVDGRQMSSPGGMAVTMEKIGQPQERSGSVDGRMNTEAVIGESVGCDVEAGAARRKAMGSERKTTFRSQTEPKKSRNVKKLSTRDRLKKKLRL